MNDRFRRRVAAVAAVIPPVLDLHGGERTVAQLEAELEQPRRVVEVALRALEREAYVTRVGDRVRLTETAREALTAWAAEIEAGVA